MWLISVDIYMLEIVLCQVWTNTWKQFTVLANIETRRLYRKDNINREREGELFHSLDKMFSWKNITPNKLSSYRSSFKVVFLPHQQVKADYEVSDIKKLYIVFMSFNMVFLELCSYLPFLKTVITKIKFGLLKKGSLCILSTTLLFSLNDKHETWKCFIIGEI